MARFKLWLLILLLSTTACSAGLNLLGRGLGLSAGYTNPIIQSVYFDETKNRLIFYWDAKLDSEYISLEYCFKLDEDYNGLDTLRIDFVRLNRCHLADNTTEEYQQLEKVSEGKELRNYRIGKNQYLFSNSETKLKYIIQLLPGETINEIGYYSVNRYGNFLIALTNKDRTFLQQQTKCNGEACFRLRPDMAAAILKNNTVKIKADADKKWQASFAYVPLPKPKTDGSIVLMQAWEQKDWALFHLPEAVSTKLADQGIYAIEIGAPRALLQ